MLLVWSSIFYFIFIPFRNPRWLLCQLCFLIGWYFKNLLWWNIPYMTIYNVCGFFCFLFLLSIENPRWKPQQDNIFKYGTLWEIYLTIILLWNHWKIWKQTWLANLPFLFQWYLLLVLGRGNCHSDKKNKNSI
jgi:hypothetical protein